MSANDHNERSATMMLVTLSEENPCVFPFSSARTNSHETRVKCKKPYCARKMYFHGHYSMSEWYLYKLRKANFANPLAADCRPKSLLPASGGMQQMFRAGILTNQKKRTRHRFLTNFPETLTKKLPKMNLFGTIFKFSLIFL